jgi:hypothetical protein
VCVRRRFSCIARDRANRPGKRLGSARPGEPSGASSIPVVSCSRRANDQRWHRQPRPTCSSVASLITSFVKWCFRSLTVCFLDVLLLCCYQKTMRSQPCIRRVIWILSTTEHRLRNAQLNPYNWVSNCKFHSMRYTLPSLAGKDPQHV